MTRKRSSFSADIHELPRVPLIEIAGERRVLIENHQGVMEYGDSRICVRVKFGCVRICGECLVIAKMTAEQLIICGKINAVELLRRETY